MSKSYLSLTGAVAPLNYSAPDLVYIGSAESDPSSPSGCCQTEQIYPL